MLGLAWLMLTRMTCLFYPKLQLSSRPPPVSGDWRSGLNAESFESLLSKHVPTESVAPFLTDGSFFRLNQPRVCVSAHLSKCESMKRVNAGSDQA